MDSSKNVKLIHLEKQKELRFVVHEPGEKIILHLMEGSAELFGSELNINVDYVFPYFSAVTIFTWSGCTLKLNSNASKIKCKIKSSNEICKMINLHGYLQNVRESSEINCSKCPIILFTGSQDVGKSTLCRFLLNYATRHNRKPIFVDLDVGQSTVSIAGTFGILPVIEPCDVNGKFNEKLLSVYYFGYKSPGHNIALYKLLLKKLGNALKVRLNDDDFKKSEILIDTCGWIDGEGYKLITEVIRLLEVNIVIAMGNNSLYTRLKRDVSRDIDIIFLPEFKSTVTRNRTVRKDRRDSSIYEYFYGSLKPWHPYTIKVNFSDLQIFKAISSRDIKSCDSDYISNVIPVPIEPYILYQILGLSYAEQIKDILLTSVFGFICIIELDMETNIASVLSPQPGPLPSKYLLMGDVTITPDLLEL